MQDKEEIKLPYETEQQIAAKVIWTLEKIALRIRMYVSDGTPEGLQQLLHGFYMALHMCGFRHTDMRNQVIYDRGWCISSMGELWQMREKGMNDDQMIQEIFTIEIETWKRMYSIE
jgi:hypothetical protein